MMLGKLDVLLVEDSQDDVFFTRCALDEIGLNYSLHVVSDGESAIEFLNKERRFSNAPTPDFIFLDLNLPKVTGRDVFRFIQRNDALRSIPVCLMITCPGWVDMFSEEDLSSIYRLEKCITAEKILNTLNPILSRKFQSV